MKPFFARIHPLLHLGLAVLILIAAQAVVQAQNATGTILGHIADPTGAIVSGAEVTVRNVDTGITQTSKTNDAGDYVFVNLHPGQYELLVAAPGFKNAQAPGLKVDVDATLRQNFKLELGSAQEQITVQADAQMLQSDNASLGTVIESKLIDSLPVIGRDFTNLLRLQAGATQVKGSSQLYWAQHGVNSDFTSVSINGARTESVSYLVDGIMDNDQFFSTANNIPNSEAIAEFKVQNGMYGAEYGQGSAQVNVALKAGGNAYHGSVYDYLQNDAFQPHNPYYQYQRDVLGDTSVSTKKEALKLNQYGFSLSGPVSIPKYYSGKNRTFFFYSYEAARKRQNKQGQARVPSEQERSGDFSDWKDASGNLIPIFDPSSQTGDNPATRSAFAGNKITNLSTIAKNFLALYPKPNSPRANMASCVSLGCWNYLTTLSRPTDTDNNTFRVDHTLTDKDHLYFSSVLAEQTYRNPSAMPLTGEIKWQKNRLFAFNWERAITPNMFNEVRVGYNWQYWQNGPDSANVDYAKQLGFTNTLTNSNLWQVPVLSMSGFSTLGNGNANWHQKENIYQLVENLKYIHGRHTMTFGFDIRRMLLDMTAAYSAEGSLDFNGAYTSSDPNNSNNPGTVGAGSAVADLLLGNPIGLGAPTPGGSDLFNVRATSWNFFAQDDWRITPRLTINAGIRYEIPPSFHSVNGSGVALNLDNGGSFSWANKNTATTLRALAGVDPYLIGYTSNDKLVQSNKLNFAPRVGFAWRPLTSDRFVVRGGYGIFYDLQNQWYSLTTFDDISTYIGQASFPTSTGYTRVAPTKLDGLWPSVGNDYSWFQNAYWKMGPQVIWPKNKSPYNQQWTLDTQFAISPTVMVDLAYVGSHALHQPGYWYYNAGRMPAVNDSCNRFRSREEASQSQSSCLSDPNFVPVLDRANFSHIRSNAYSLANIFSANYNALQARLTQRLSQGLNYQMNYTYSRTLDEVSAINNIEGSQLTLQNNNCTGCDWGPSSSDQTHRFVTSGSYQLPVGKGRKWSAGKIGDWVVGGWNVTGDYTIASGNPFTLTNTGDSTLGQDGVRGDLRRPNQVGNPHGQVYGALDSTKYKVAQFKSDLYHWFNPAAYAVGAGNTYGNVTRNSLRGPYYTRGDMTFEKNFPIIEKNNLMYRFEIFNLFSTWHSSNPNPKGTLSDGAISSLVDLDTDKNGAPLAEALQGGTRHLWQPRIIQMTLKYTF